MRIITWPEGVAAEVGIGVTSLKAMRANGDAPELYAASERRLVTTDEALAEWIKAKKVPVSYRCRPPTRSADTRQGVAA